MFQFATSLKANLFFPSTPVSSLRPPRIHHTRSLILFSNTHNTAPSPQKKISSGSLFLTHFPISDFRSLLYVLTIHATSCKLQSLRPTSKKKNNCSPPLRSSPSHCFSITKKKYKTYLLLLLLLLSHLKFYFSNSPTNSSFSTTTLTPSSALTPPPPSCTTTPNSSPVII
jgi:hypothetical protein